MKLDKIEVQNFLGVRELKIDPIAPVVLVHGPNGSGKSSLREAIRFAALGQPERVDIVREYPQLIRDTADQAMIAAGFTDAEGQIRNVVIQLRKSGKHSGVPERDPSTKLPMLMTPSEFANLRADERKRLIQQLSQVSISHDRVVDACREAGADMDLVEELGPMLRTGMQNCEKECSARAAEQRKVWCNVTGRPRYGEHIAETWSFETEDLQSNSLALQEEIDKLNRELGEAEGVVEKSAEYTRYQKRIQNELARLDEKAKDYEELRKSALAYHNDMQRAKTKAQDLRERVAVEEGPEFITQCPKCETALVWGEGERLLIADVKRSMGRRQKQTLLDNAKAAEKQRETYALHYARAEKLMQAAQKAKVEADAIRSIDPPEAIKPKDAKAAHDKAIDLREQIEELQRRKAEIQAIEKRNATASAVTDAAREAHKRIKGWVQLQELMGPNGISKQLMERALRPFNERLMLAQRMNDWPLVQLDEDLTIRAGGRRYNLLSESEKWRADAQIAEAIAAMTGINMLFLDNFDILDQPGRMQCIQWAMALAASGTQVMIFGTLKQRYSIDGVQSVWLG